MLERQHLGLKNSLKAALIDMGETHQSRCFDFLPFVLLGRRVAYQPDLGASASEMTFGKNVSIPGELLSDPDEGSQSFQQLLDLVRKKTATTAIQPSRHSSPEGPLPPIPIDVTHVYTRQHHQTGLLPSFEGPFRVAEKTSRSVWKIEVGTYKDGRKRYEYRHLNDLKLAHPKSLAAPAERPRLGRPTKTLTSDSTDTSDATDAKSLECQQSSQDLNRFPQPPLQSTTAQNKQAAGRAKSHLPAANTTSRDHATSTHDDREPASVEKDGLTTGPPPVPAFPTARSIRSTRNPNLCYVDSITFDTTTSAWSVSKDQLDQLNYSINRKHG